MASKHLAPSRDPVDAPATKKPRPDFSDASERRRVVLNPADCDLDFDIDGNGLQGHALHTGGFAYCWSGARANVGITKGAYCFGCKIISEQKVDMPDTPPDQQHVCRVGISRGDDPVGNLGESIHSFGYGGTAKFSNAAKFSDYGLKFGVGDTITCCVNLDNQPLASIGFSKNGKWLGIAKHFDVKSWGFRNANDHNRPWEYALFPHVLLKNVVVQLLFSEEDGLVLEEGYKSWNSAVRDGNAVHGPSLLSQNKSEVLMMVGLPASGKTTWAEKWVKEHPEKRYIILGTNLALDQMKVPGLLRKQNYGERFDRLMQQATGIFNTLLERVSKIPRNYILDQTNVYRRARIRKLKSFQSYHKIAVITFPTPNALKLRAEKRFKEMGKEVPKDAVNEMIANYEIPMMKNTGSGEPFDEVIFTELSRLEAQKYLDEMKQELQTSASNPVKVVPPYSRQSSIQSFSSPYSNEKVYNPAAYEQLPSFQPTGSLYGCDNLSNPQGNMYPVSSGYHQVPRSSGNPQATGSFGEHQAFGSSEYYRMPASFVDHRMTRASEDFRASSSLGNQQSPGALGNHQSPVAFGYHQSPVSFGYHQRPMSFGEQKSTGSLVDDNPPSRYQNLEYVIAPTHQTFPDCSVVPGDVRVSQTHSTSEGVGRVGFDDYSSPRSYDYPRHPYSSPAAQIYGQRFSHVDNLDSREPFRYEPQNPGQERPGPPYAAPPARSPYGNPSPYASNPGPAYWNHP